MPDRPFARLTSSLAESTWRFPPSNGSATLACDARTLITTLRDGGGTRKTWDDPLEALRWLWARVAAGDFPPASRWIGFMSYDAGRLFEKLPGRAVDDLNLPLFVFALHEPSERPVDPLPRFPPGEGPLESNFTRESYQRAVGRVLNYIRAGDVFQVNLSQRLTCGLRAQPAEVFDVLRRRSPAPYGALLVYDDWALLSNSPELFLRVTPLPGGSGRRRVVTQPIKGTRPRLPGMEAALRNSAKDQAELNMIIDLERNDLGRVCETGSVKVTRPREIEALPTVYHGVATVEGVLRPDVGLVDLLRATFPGGSVTGAPKIRAMQIIDELEPVRRGPYCGAIGYVGGDGTIELNVAIRTMIIKDGVAHLPVGGGVVADSDPAAEYEETLVKARAMLTALGVPERFWPV